MPESRFRHPLRWWQFYVACLRHAGSGVLGVIGDASTILGALIFGVKLAAPGWYAAGASFLTASGRENLPIGIPLSIGCAILLLRLLAAPFAVYQDSQVQRLEDAIAASAHTARRPKVAIERGASDGRPVTFDWKQQPASLALMGMTPLFEFVNVGEESAFNVQASIAIEPTDFRIECVAPVVAAGKRVAPDLKLFKGVEQWRDAPAFDIEKFAHAALTRLIAMRAEDEERRMADEPGVHKWDLDIARDSLYSHLDLPLKTGLSVDFNVTYVDFERKWFFRTPHLMTFTPTLQPKSGEFKITLSAKPEPLPTPVESAPAVLF